MINILASVGLVGGAESEPGGDAPVAGRGPPRGAVSPPGCTLILPGSRRPAPGAKLWGAGPRLQGRLGPWNWRRQSLCGLRDISVTSKIFPMQRTGVGVPSPFLTPVNQFLSGDEAFCFLMGAEKGNLGGFVQTVFHSPSHRPAGALETGGRVLAPQSLLHASKTLGDPSLKSAFSSFW